jgi:hypothetical protein
LYSEKFHSTVTTNNLVAAYWSATHQTNSLFQWAQPCCWWMSHSFQKKTHSLTITTEEYHRNKFRIIQEYLFRFDSFPWKIRNKLGIHWYLNCSWDIPLYIKFIRYGSKGHFTMKKDLTKKLSFFVILWAPVSIISQVIVKLVAQRSLTFKLNF